MPELQEVLGFAYDFYRKPLRYKADLAKIWPDAAVFRELLETIRGKEKSAQFRKYAEKIGAAPDELHGACTFFIKQSLFREENNHYQVLGLTREATAENIRRHYRLLITLFHPDRAKIDEAWMRIYVTRLNEAYSTLKNQGKRDLYDRKVANGKIKPSAKNKAARLRQGKWVQKGVDPSALGSGSLVERLYRFSIWQKHPKWVVAILLWILVALVLVGIWPESRVESFRRNESSASTESQGAVSQGSQGKTGSEGGRALSDFQLYKPYSPIKGEKTSLAGSERGGEPGTPLAVEKIDLSQPEQAFDQALEVKEGLVMPPLPPKLSPPINQFEGAAAPDISISSPGNREGDAQRGKQGVRPVRLESPKAPAARQDTVMNGVPPHEQILARFILAYEEGDLDRLLSLFATDVVTNEGIGVDWVKREYGRQFEGSTRRFLRISNVKLLSSANVWIDMKMRFEIDLWKRDNETLERLAGEAIMSLHKSGDRYLIKEHKSYVEKQ